MNRRNLLSRRQRGVTIVEGLIALAVLALLYFAVAGYSGMSFTSNDTNRTAGELTSIHAGVRGLYSNQSNYGTGSLNTALITAKVFPGTLRTAAPSTVNNNWGGAVVVTGATSTFTVAYDAMPAEICAKLLPTLSSNTWDNVTVNGGSAVTFPVSPAAAATECSAAANDVVLTSRG